MTSHFRDLLTTDGSLERPVAQALIEVPRALHLEDEWLVWEPGAARRCRPGDGVLEDFLQLADASNATILMFAKRHGILGLCEAHDLPVTHNTSPSRSIEWPEDTDRFCVIRSRSKYGPRRAEMEHREPLAAWRELSAEASAILRLTTILRAGRPTAVDDWQTLFRRDPSVQSSGRPIPWWPQRKETAPFEQALVARKVNDWIDMGNLRPRLSWGFGFGKGGVTISTSALVEFSASRNASSLFAALALQLLFAVSSTSGLAICTSCSAPFVPRRQPRAGKRRYCDDCRELGRPWRDAKRDARKIPPS